MQAGREGMNTPHPKSSSQAVHYGVHFADIRDFPGPPPQLLYEPYRCRITLNPANEDQIEPYSRLGGAFNLLCARNPQIFAKTEFPDTTPAAAAIATSS